MAVASKDSIDRVRQKVRDPRPPFATATGPKPLYEDQVYDRAFRFGLEKLSYDFDEAYLVDTDVPRERQFLLVKLATIEMCYVRAGDEANGNTTTDQVQSISVPDLSISESGGQAGADFWLNLADKLENEYKDEVGTHADNTAPGSPSTMPEVVVGTFSRMSLRTNSRAPYNMDVPLSAAQNVGAVPGGAGEAVVTWDPVLDPHFAWYEIYRGSGAGSLALPGTSQRVRIIPDPHGLWEDGIARTRFVDSGLSPGLYEYVVGVTNDNTLRAFSAVRQVTVT